jgi:hypothetical protein
MKILLDECLPRKLRYALADYECETVPEAGLAGQKNGRLLSLAESAGFDLFLTMDKGLQVPAKSGGPPNRSCDNPRPIQPAGRHSSAPRRVQIDNAFVAPGQCEKSRQADSHASVLRRQRRHML